MNLKDNLTKFQAKADEGIFLGYSQNSVVYRVLNKRTRKVEETFNLTFDDYYLKQTDSKFENKSILVDSDTQIENSHINDFDYDFDYFSKIIQSNLVPEHDVQTSNFGYNYSPYV